mgnify:FL=1
MFVSEMVCHFKASARSIIASPSTTSFNEASEIDGEWKVSAMACGLLDAFVRRSERKGFEYRVLSTLDQY